MIPQGGCAVFELVGGLFCPAPPQGCKSDLPPNITINISINDGNAAAHRASRCYPGCMCRSYFDSKAVYFAIRPMCRKRGLRVSGGQCGPACAMWCFFIEQAGVDEPQPYFLPGKKKKPGSFHHPAICTAPQLPTPAPRLHPSCR